MRLPLYNRRGEVIGYAAVDEDFRTKHKWFLNHGYVCRRVQVKGKWQTVRLGRQILGLRKSDSRESDHINRDKLDNRRCNLRAVTRNQNMQNRGSYSGSSSRFRGVHWDARKGKWIAKCRVDGKLHQLGCFEIEERAAEVASAFRRHHLLFSIEKGANVA